MSADRCACPGGCDAEAEFSDWCVQCMEGHRGPCGHPNAEDCAYCPLGIVPGAAVILDGFPAHPECLEACDGMSVAGLAAVRAEVLRTLETGGLTVTT